jgi:hypothetical protein
MLTPSASPTRTTMFGQAVDMFLKREESGQRSITFKLVPVLGLQMVSQGAVGKE